METAGSGALLDGMLVEVGPAGVRGLDLCGSGERVYLDTWTLPFGRTYPDEVGHLELVLKLFAFLGSPHVARREELPDRPFRREVRRAGLPERDLSVHVVELGGPRSAPAVGHGDGGAAGGVAAPLAGPRALPPPVVPLARGTPAHLDPELREGAARAAAEGAGVPGALTRPRRRTPAEATSEPAAPAHRAGGPRRRQGSRGALRRFD